MKLTELLLAELDREVPRSRRALEHAPADRYDWKPHDRSMIFGYLANMVATMPSWMAMGITRDELDVAPASGSAMAHDRLDTSAALVKALDASAADARTALRGTTMGRLTVTTPTSEQTIRLETATTITEPGVAWRFADPFTVLDRWLGETG